MRESHPKDYMQYSVKSEYVNSHSNITLKHLTCGNVFKMSPNAFISGEGCPTCGHAKAAQKNRNSKEQVSRKLPNGIKIVGNYVNAVSKTKVHCSKCGNTYLVRTHDLIRRGQCAFCSGYNKETTETFGNYVNDVTNGEYKLVGQYTKANEYVKIKHCLCDSIYEVTPHNFKHGKRCPRCISSLGESIVKSILIDEHIPYNPQKRFKGCKDKNLLSYDFYLPNYKILIEYQGEQHYHPIKQFGGNEQLSIQKRHDRIKREFSSKNNMNLIEIPYKLNDYDSIKVFLDNKIAEILRK